MAFDQIRLDRPLSRIELAVMVIVIAICAVWLLNRLAFLEALAEARALDMTVRNLRIGVMVNVSTHLLEGKYDSMAAMAQSNPVGVVIEPPPGYIGALRQANEANIQSGQWYFDEDRQQLVYRIVNSRYFESTGDGPARVRLKLKLNYDDRNNNGEYDAGVDAAQSVSVQVLDPLKWKF